MHAETSFNLAEPFVTAALRNPERLAVDWNGHSVSYGDFLKLFYQLRSGLVRAGMNRGDRILILVPVSPNLYTLLISALSLGIVVVSVDATLPRNKILDAIVAANPQVVISTNKILKFRFLAPTLRPAYLKNYLKIKFYSVDSKGWLLRSFAELLGEEGLRTPLQNAPPEAPALMTYTSGSTGRPKAADRSTAILTAQHEISRDLWPHASDEVDMPCFPMLALQNLSCGITTVLPDFGDKTLDSYDPAKIVQQIIRAGVTRISGPPSFFLRLTTHLLATNTELRSVRSLVAGGANVPAWLAEKITEAFPNTSAYIVYGSTEAEPISYVDMKEWTSEKDTGAGYLVGKPIVEAKVCIFPPGEIDEIPLDSARFLGPLFPGEIILQGPHVVRQYRGNEQANRLTKIPDGSGGIWHRTGDEGYLDEKGRVWIVGRLKDRILVGGRSIPHFPLEQKIEQIPGVVRAALLNGTGGVRVFLETGSLRANQDGINEGAIRKCLGENGVTEIECIRVLKKIPVDHRHFWKIDRNALREMS